jgi:hypothetical protein
VLSLPSLSFLVAYVLAQLCFIEGPQAPHLSSAGQFTALRHLLYGALGNSEYHHGFGYLDSFSRSDYPIVT